MYYTTCGSGDFTNMWLKTVRLQYSVHWRGTLPNFSHKQRESAETSDHFAEQECIELSRQVMQSHVIPTWCNGEAEFNKCMHAQICHSIGQVCKGDAGFTELMNWSCFEIQGAYHSHKPPRWKSCALTYITVMPTLPLLVGDLRFFALSPALVHKSPAFYVHYKYWILSKK